MPNNAVTDRTADRRTADVIVIGAGVIGLSTAFELGRAGASCIIVGPDKPGMASGAAAGLLAPSVGRLPPAASALFIDSLGRFPALLTLLREFDRDLELITGLIDVSSSNSHDEHTLSRESLQALEPSVAPTGCARFFPQDGAIDNIRLLASYRTALRQMPRISRVQASVRSIHFRPGEATAVLQTGESVTGHNVVLAAGAWSNAILGLPRTLPVRPLKGQMLALESNVLRHAVMADDVYLVPRRGEVAVGATVEEAGFDLAVDPVAVEHLRASAVSICPSLGSAPVLRAWAGLRPATPDMLPIVGRDAAEPRLIYACGHSKNGILLAPVTAVAVADLCAGRPSLIDLSPFSVNRFANPAGS